MSIELQNKQFVKDQVLYLENTFSDVVIRLTDGRSEQFRLNSTCPAEFVIQEPAMDAAGNVTIDLEILKFEVAAVSEILWPGEKITISGGRLIGSDALPIHGKVTIPAGKTLADGVESVQLVYLQVDSPIGTLHNVKPAHMEGTLTQIPPVGSYFRNFDPIELYDGSMQIVGYAAICGSGS